MASIFVFLCDSCVFYACVSIEKNLLHIVWVCHLSIKNPIAKELSQEMGGGTLAGNERILGNSIEERETQESPKETQTRGSWNSS